MLRQVDDLETTREGVTRVVISQSVEWVDGRVRRLHEAGAVAVVSYRWLLDSVSNFGCMDAADYCQLTAKKAPR